MSDPSTQETEALARELYRYLYPGDVNTPDSDRTRESDAREHDRAYATWDAGREGYAPGGICRDIARHLFALGYRPPVGVPGAIISAEQQARYYNQFQRDPDTGVVRVAAQTGVPSTEGTEAQERTEALVDAAALVAAKAQDADYWVDEIWVDEIAEWEGSEAWEREAHPDNRPGTAYEDRDYYRKTARAVLAAMDEAARSVGVPTQDEREALEAIWDDGNATGLDGWVGPGRGTEPVDREAILARDRALEKHISGLRRQVCSVTETDVTTAHRAFEKFPEYDPSLSRSERIHERGAIRAALEAVEAKRNEETT